MKPVKNFEGLYSIDQNGHLYSHVNSKTKKLVGSKDSKGYRRAVLKTLDGKKAWKYLHRLTCEAYIPNPENKSQVNHINNDPSDNRISNLEWATPKENTQHCLKQGRSNRAFGSRQSSAKLTEKDIPQIRRLIEQKLYTQNQIADFYGVHNCAITYIKQGICWSRA